MIKLKVLCVATFLFVFIGQGYAACTFSAYYGGKTDSMMYNDNPMSQNSMEIVKINDRLRGYPSPKGQELDNLTKQLNQLHKTSKLLSFTDRSCTQAKKSCEAAIKRIRLYADLYSYCGKKE